EATQEWADNGRAVGHLLTGARLLEAEESFGPQHEGLNELEANFLRSSIEGREHEARRKLEAQQARTRVLQRSLVAVGSFAVIAVVAAGVAITARTQAERERRLAHSRELAGAALRERVTFKAHSGVVWSVAFSPDGQRVVTAGDDKAAS